MMIKDYSELTSRIAVQLSPELTKEFYAMLCDIQSTYETKITNLKTIHDGVVKMKYILSILKKKQVDINEIKILLSNLKHCDDIERCKRYNMCRKVGYKLKQEEFNLIKEWLLK